jgi:cyclase
MGTEEIAPGIRVVGTRTAEGKAGAIAGERAVLAVDAGLDRDEGEAVAAVARGFGPRAILLCLTHAHSDHAYGGGAFAGGEIIAHALAADALRADLAARAAAAAQPPMSKVAEPTIRFTGDLQVDLGGRLVDLLETPGHAPGAVCVFVPDAGVLFGGDTIVTSIPPSFSDGDANVLERSLRVLARLDAGVVVPGHGPLLRGHAVVRDRLTSIADYLAAVSLFVDRQIEHAEPSVIIEAATYARFLGALLPETPELVSRHRENVRCAIRDAVRERTALSRPSV